MHTRVPLRLAIHEVIPPSLLYIDRVGEWNDDAKKCGKVRVRICCSESLDEGISTRRWRQRMFPKEILFLVRQRKSPHYLSLIFGQPQPIQDMYESFCASLNLRFRLSAQTPPFPLQHI